MINFLLKGLLRDRSRSLFPVIITAAGAFITVLLYTFMNGMMGDMIEASAKFDAGHLKVVTKAYGENIDQLPNDLCLTGVSGLMESLGKDFPGIVWSPRIRFGGLLDIPDEKNETRSQGPVLGMGVQLFEQGSPEPRNLNLAKSLTEGSLPANPGEILISARFAKKLGVKPGETATLIGSTMYGNMAIYNFKVAGLLNFGIDMLDRGTIIADISDVRKALDMDDAAGEVLGFSKKGFFEDKKMVADAAMFNAENSGSGKDDFSPVMLTLRDSGDMGMYIDIVSMFSWIIIGIFVFVMSIVLWNSGLMNGIRRYGEIGIRLALGEPKGVIYRRMIMESLLLGIAGSALGTAIGLAVSYYLQYVGIDFTGKLQQSNVMFVSLMRARVNAFSYVIGFFPGLFAPLLGTIASGLGIYRRQTSQLFKELEV